MSEIEPLDSSRKTAPRDPIHRYMIIGGALLVVIVVAIILLVTLGIPALTGPGEPTAISEPVPTATPVPTFTPAPSREPTHTPEPVPETEEALVMLDPEAPIYDLSAGARPALEWTGFFGQVQDGQGNPVEGVSVIIWTVDGQPASPVTRTNADGYYEIHLAEAPLAGTWTIQLLDNDNQPLSRLFTFKTDLNTDTGIQQIQVMWKPYP